jgi:hypothetical protein
MDKVKVKELKGEELISYLMKKFDKTRNEVLISLLTRCLFN